MWIGISACGGLAAVLVIFGVIIWRSRKQERAKSPEAGRKRAGS